MPFDLLIKGGRVVDPAAGLDAVRDIAISAGRITAVEPSITEESATTVIDARDRLVTPGLIDMHTHVNWGASLGGVDADSIAWRTGVTTWIDAGSAGAFTMPALRKHVIEPAEARILAYINISYLGLVGLNYDEYCNREACNIEILRRVAEQSPDIVKGIKVRMGKEGFCYPDLGILRRAVEASEATGLRLMCHLSGTPPELRDVLALLRPGDIVTCPPYCAPVRQGSCSTSGTVPARSRSSRPRPWPGSGSGPTRSRPTSIRAAWPGPTWSRIRS